MSRLLSRWFGVTACVAFGTSVWFAWKSSQANVERARIERLAQWQDREHAKELQRLEAELAAAKSAQLKPQSAAGLSTNRPTSAMEDKFDAEAIISELTRLRIRSGSSRVSDLHEVVFRLRKLAHGQDRAVPAIGNYLRRFEDVDYPLAGEKAIAALEAENESTASNANPALADIVLDPNASSTLPENDATAARNRSIPRSSRSSRLQFEFLTPPSLRLGLFDVLAEIGSAEAQKVLLESLNQTGRGIEVAYISRKLEALAPKAHRDAALSVTRELLLNPPTLQGHNTFDRLQSAYLYSVLDFFHDTTFAANAPAILVDARGKLNRDAYRFLIQATPASSHMSAVYDAYNRLAPTNFADRSRLLQTALPHAGLDPSANAMIRQVISDDKIRPEIRGLVISSLGHLAPRRDVGGRSEVDADAVQQRLQFLSQIKTEFPDPKLNRGIDRAVRQLQEQLEPTERKSRGGNFRLNPKP